MRETVMWRTEDSDAPTNGQGYANPSVLVSTAWVAGHLDHPGIRMVEVDVDTSAYDHGHVAGAIGWNWTTELCDTVVRDVVSKDALERLLGRSGIDRSTTVVLYGDNNNWFAAWASWQLKLYGHPDVRLMNGGRKKWVAEGRPLTREIPRPGHLRYAAQELDTTFRARLAEVQAASATRSATLIDVRGPQEFSGELLAPPGLPETCQRGGHIPGAVNVPWGQACNEDGTFRSRAELEALYRSVGVTPERPVITYCRIGERSSHTWFVLTELMGHPNVKNYDGSWTEWGNLVGAPIAKG
jgi:thiosulfate/3-mercaptopyruvate sulfurtransferase